MKPRARNENLLIHEVDGELVVYDRGRKEAHRLSASAALVWKHLDGTKSVSDLAELVSREFDVTEGEDIVLSAIAQFEDAHLLVTDGEVSRRQAVRKLVAAGAMAAMVTSIAAPTAAMAMSHEQGPAGPI